MKGHAPTGRQPDFYRSVAEVLRAARTKACRAVNFAMVEAYWHIGRTIVEEEQQGRERGDYGTAVTRNLSVRLTEEFGGGFSEQSLRNMRQFFLCFPIRSAMRSELAWTHYELLGIPDAHAFRESELEQAVIDRLQAFMLELGNGFAFVARQMRVRTETKECYVDLVFYNYILKCFVLVDLKTGELTHQDIGQ